jgi:hypothetical protein
MPNTLGPIDYEYHGLVMKQQEKVESYLHECDEEHRAKYHCKPDATWIQEDYVTLDTGQKIVHKPTIERIERGIRNG